MSHNLEIDRVTGKARMFYVGETPWHRLGQELPEEEYYDLEKAIVRAGADWEVGLEPLYLKDGRSVHAYQQAVIRMTDKKILGTVGPRWTPLQNRVAFNFFQPYLEERLARLQTAGILDGGRRIWVMAQIGDGIMKVSRSVEIAKNILLSNAHDGSLAVRVGFTPINVVCANTLAMAHSPNVSSLIRVRHTRQMEVNLENIRETMSLADAEFKATAEQYRKLISKSINQGDLIKYVKKVFGVDKIKDDDVSTRTENQMKRVCELFETGRGNRESDVKGSAWAAYQAITEYLSYESGRSNETRLNSLWFGQNSTTNKQAFELALAMAV